MANKSSFSNTFSGGVGQVFQAAEGPMTVNVEAPVAPLNADLDPASISVGSFISTATDEAAVARVVQTWVEQFFPSLSPCFVAEANIRVGERWLDCLSTALMKAKFVFVIASEASLTRPWVNFEVGAAWARGVPIALLMHGALTPASIPDPHRFYQARRIDKPDDVQRFFDELSETVGRPRIEGLDYTQFASHVVDATALIDKSS